MKIIIRAVSGAATGYHILTDGAMHVLGRSGSADWTLKDDHASRKHCRIQVENGVVYVRDLGSQNGTFLNDEAVPPEGTHWVPGMRLRIGETFFELVVEEQPDADRLLKMKIKSHAALHLPNLPAPEKPLPEPETATATGLNCATQTALNIQLSQPLSKD